MKTEWPNVCCKHDEFVGNKRSQSAFAGWPTVTTVLAVLLLLTISSVQAEVRTYLQVSTALLPKQDHKRDFKLNIFLREESRYRESGLVLNKLFIGVRPTFRPWLLSQFYYANKDMDYTQHQNKHMLVGDIILSSWLGLFTLKDRSGNEWHITDRFYRYRNYFEVAWRTPIRQLTVWTAEEWRYDSDQSRVNVNDIRLGIGLHLRKELNTRIFIDLESNRRSVSNWQQKPFLGLEISSAL